MYENVDGYSVEVDSWALGVIMLFFNFNYFTFVFIFNYKNLGIHY